MTANEEILGGLKSAIERGQSLERAMNSLFNAGYTKAEIEEAARALSEQPVPQKPVEIPKEKITEPKQSFFKKLIPEKKPIAPTQILSVPTPEGSNNVSYYGEKKSKINPKILVILLVSLSIFLIGILILFLLTLR